MLYNYLTFKHIEVSKMTNQSNVSVIGKGGVSGYVNVNLELKTSPSGVHYLQVLLNRGKKKDSDEFLPSYSVMAYGNVAKLMASTIQKGDLIRVTKLNIAPNKDDAFTKHNIGASFSLVVEEFEKIVVGQRQDTNQQRAPQQRAPEPQPQQSAPQRQPEPQAAIDAFDDDIPF